MTSKYNNFALDSSGPIEVDINAVSGEPVLTTTAKKRTSKMTGSKRGSPTRKSASPRSSAKKEVAHPTPSLNFSRLKAQNETGFTHDSVETGHIENKVGMTPLGQRKTSMFPEISAVEQFYDKN